MALVLPAESSSPLVPPTGSSTLTQPLTGSSAVRAPVGEPIGNASWVPVCSLSRQAWDLAVDICLSQLPTIIEEGTAFRVSPISPPTQGILLGPCSCFSSSKVGRILQQHPVCPPLGSPPAFAVPTPAAPAPPPTFPLMHLEEAKTGLAS